MTFRTFLKNAFTIQYILVYFGLITLAITIHYKSQAVTIFKDYEKESMELIILNNSIAMGGGTIKPKLTKSAYSSGRSMNPSLISILTLKTSLKTYVCYYREK